MIPREYVVPEFELVKKDLFGRSTDDNLSIFKYGEPPLKDWFIFIGEKKDLGLFNKSTPHALAKKSLFEEMWEYRE